MNDFEGFSPAAWDFLAALGANNTSTFFDAHRATYQASIARPASALVTALAARLGEVHPALRGEPKVGRSLFRINRDTRFSADKTPYKTHVDFLFWTDDADPRSSAACIVRLTSTTILTGAGRIGLTGPALDAYRAQLVDPVAGQRLRTAVDALLAAGHELSEPVRSRPPRGYPDSINAELLCRDGFHLSRTAVHCPEIGGPDFVTWLVDRLRPYAGILDLLSG